MITEKKYPQNTKVIRLLAEKLLRTIVETGNITCFSDLHCVLDDIATQVKRTLFYHISVYNDNV